MNPGARIILTEEDDWWIAEDEETGVASQGRTREAALANLDEAIDGFHGAGEPPTDEELREAGIRATGPVELSEETRAIIEETEGELERGETISHADLKNELTDS